MVLKAETPSMKREMETRRRVSCSAMSFPAQNKQIQDNLSAQLTFLANHETKLTLHTPHHFLRFFFFFKKKKTNKKNTRTGTIISCARHFNHFRQGTTKHGPGRVTKVRSGVFQDYRTRVTNVQPWSANRQNSGKFAAINYLTSNMCMSCRHPGTGPHTWARSPSPTQD